MSVSDLFSIVMFFVFFFSPEVIPKKKLQHYCSVLTIINHYRVMFVRYDETRFEREMSEVNAKTTRKDENSYKTSQQMALISNEREKEKKREWKRHERDVDTREIMSDSLPSFVLQNGVVHRDLKLENVLLDENCNIKVND